MGKSNRQRLQEVWEQLDIACGALDNAQIEIARLKTLHRDIFEASEEVYLSDLVSLKNKIEEALGED